MFLVFCYFSPSSKIGIGGCFLLEVPSWCKKKSQHDWRNEPGVKKCKCPISSISSWLPQKQPLREDTNESDPLGGIPRKTQSRIRKQDWEGRRTNKGSVVKPNPLESIVGTIP
jgi:hypothetical protein